MAITEIADLTIDGPDQAPPPFPVDVKQPPAEPVDPEGDEPEPEAAAPVAEPVKPKKGSFQARIDELVREKGETERSYQSRVQSLESELASLRPKLETKAVAADGEPDPSDTTKYPEGQYDRSYLKDQARWEARQEFQAQQAQAESFAAQRAIVDSLHDMGARGRAAHPDFDDKLTALQSAGIQLSPMVADVSLRHPLGHELAYALADDHALAERISRIAHPVAAGIELGLVIARLSAANSGPAKAPVLSLAPPVIKPVTGSPNTPSVADDIDDDSEAATNAYIARRQKELRRA